MTTAHHPSVLVGVTDHLDPELQAMILAKYSRSYGSLLSRLPENEQSEAKVKALLKETYVNYGHKSVGQLGHTTIFFEGISMLAAISVEVSELFNGQESSTRYIPFHTQPAIDCGNEQIGLWQDTWRAFYIEALDQTIADLMVQYPCPTETEKGTWERTIKARAFDICGGILPAGFTTSVGFTGSFDVINDHLSWMANHPLAEVNQLAYLACKGLMEKYPSAAYSWEKLCDRSDNLCGPEVHADRHIDSYYYRAGQFEHQWIHTTTYDSISTGERSYPIVDDAAHPGRNSKLTLACLGTSDYGLNYFRLRLSEMGSAERLPYRSFPRPLSNALRFRTVSQMDFRTYRDTHRHRNGNRPLPLLTMDFGLHEYYTENLSPALGKKFKELFAQQKEHLFGPLKDMSDEKEINLLKLNYQYAIPMAAEVPYYYECDLNQLLYMIERRTDPTAHQTVRIEQMAVYELFHSVFPNVKVGANMQPNNFTYRRGEQTFAEHKQSA